jgi:SAM-dependent methyltransferase
MPPPNQESVVTQPESNRSGSFAEHTKPTVVDRFGVWLSRRSVVRHAGTMAGARIADIGCGYQASLSRNLIDEVAHVTLLDLAIAPDLAQNPKVTLLVGSFDDQIGLIADGSLDTVFCISVLEHLQDDGFALAEFRRILRPGGTLVVNVPSWWGKTALEFSAFRLKLSPREEMDDHKRYYDPRDLWPLLVKAGFVPHGIRCKRHKFGLNTLAVCRVEEPYREDRT